jgi:antitoxin (DNA-binding transcriptional repressor) of toxin-antitoxin stability system
MTTISIGEIQRDLPGYLRRVQAGESLLITDHDEPIAELKPVPAVGGQRPFGLAAGEFRIPDDFDAPLVDPNVVSFLKTRVNEAKVPLRWRQEGVADPTRECRQSCSNLTEQLFAEHGMLPIKVIASRQEGIYLEYKSPDGERTLGVEVDNDLDVVAAVSDASEVLASAAFEGDGAQQLLRIFFGGMATAAGNPRPANSQ